ncbi:bis(5'-nucleosyl)-tetraphosphatase (symmetrical) YqeK [Bacillus sp. BP-3]|uniref:bis(5'-nucleosyl)-tetraphosphatase (symmetrical) YqeK n=1 Tax=Bacillus sp. BP-3 TaxID=3022773 RepID=UPI00232CADDF|nr:bis(5'-nucleosyl)-tetraphosphatase (symmetrical) YqeK [Bacillus sp. BP-3]MDC2864459.1 bis(5'-nucleosyl)-tetraphosphatase (symmetrical) YqeK [Bacillus sp. BP-3]
MNQMINSISLTGDWELDIKQMLEQYNKLHTYEHSVRVANEAKRIAKRFELDEEAAAIAGYLHDISAIIPNDQRIQVAETMQIEVLQEERIFPMIIHQKLSKRIAHDIFKVENETILNAISCHTTLRKNATHLDMVLFVADKIKWDQSGTPPYITEIQEALEQSLEHACFAYISYLWERKQNLKVVHPWLQDAYFDLKEKLGVE